MTKLSAFAVVILLSACTAAVVPVRVTSSPDITATTTQMRVRISGTEKAQLTRGAVAEGALGTKWLIDARDALTSAVRTAIPEGDARAPALDIQVRDFDVDWSAQKAGGVSELTIRAIVQIDYDLQTEASRHTGSVVGRGRHVDTGWGPKIDQRIGANIDRVVGDAIGAAMRDLVTDLERLQKE
jgi:hypothetical protein